MSIHLLVTLCSLLTHGKKIGEKYYLINFLRCSPAWTNLYKSMGLAFPWLIWDSLLTNGHKKKGRLDRTAFLGYTETIRGDW